MDNEWSKRWLEWVEGNFRMVVGELSAMYLSYTTVLKGLSKLEPSNLSDQQEKTLRRIWSEIDDTEKRLEPIDKARKRLRSIRRQIEDILDIRFVEQHRHDRGQGRPMEEVLAELENLRSDDDLRDNHPATS